MQFHSAENPSATLTRRDAKERGVIQLATLTNVHPKRKKGSCQAQRNVLESVERLTRDSRIGENGPILLEPPVGMYSGPLGYILRRDCRGGLRRVLAVDDRCGGQTRNDEARDLATRQGCNCENHGGLDTRQVSFRIVIAAEILYRRPSWNYLRQLRC